MGYDSWLEKPYQDAYAAGDHFVDWCESEGIDPDDPTAQSRYEDAMEAAEEDAMLRAHEAKMEAREFDMMERGEW